MDNQNQDLKGRDNGRAKVLPHLDKGVLWSYLLRVLVLTGVMYFTFLEVTGLILVAAFVACFITMPGYLILCACLVCAPFPNLHFPTRNSSRLDRFVTTLCCVALGSALCYGALANLYEYRQSVPYRELGALTDKLAEEADEIIFVNHSTYSKDYTNQFITHPRLWHGAETTSPHLLNSILVDYDTMEVSFLNLSNSLALTRVTLEEQVTATEGVLDLYLPLRQEGVVLSTYNFSTVQLSFPDGRVYSGSALQDETGQSVKHLYFPLFDTRQAENRDYYIVEAY